MRIATEEAERLTNQTQPKVLTMAEATRWAKDVMRVMSLRSSQCSSRIQIATVGEEGVDISGICPMYVSYVCYLSPSTLYTVYYLDVSTCSYCIYAFSVLCVLLIAIYTVYYILS